MRRKNPEHNLDASLEYLDKNTIPGERWVFIEDERLQDHSILVSNLGRVFNSVSCSFLKEYGGDNIKPYCYLNCYGEPVYTKTVEELVSICFLEKHDSDERLFLDHIDGDITNSRASNLKWRTLTEMKEIRAAANQSDYAIKSLRERMVQANDECDSWMKGYWNLYFKYVPENKRNENLKEETWNKKDKSAGEMFMFCSRDHNAEGVQPQNRDIMDYAKDYSEDKFDEEAWEQRKKEDTNK